MQYSGRFLNAFNWILKTEGDKHPFIKCFQYQMVIAYMISNYYSAA